jgi:hypothetical protein
MTATLSFQCLLRQDGSRIVAWIEKRGARVSARVELEDEPGLWEVAEVFGPPRTASWLTGNARRVHKGLPSWRRAGSVSRA